MSYYRYIELNPVRAGMVTRAGDYPWSSYRHNALGAPDPLIHPHACYRQLGSTEADRLQIYREWVQHACKEDANRFSSHLHHQHPMGNDRFKAIIEAQVGRKLTPSKGSRPKKQKVRALET